MRDTQITTQQVGDLLGISDVTVRNWSRDGKMPAHVTIGRRDRRWSLVEILAWLDSAKGQEQLRRADAARTLFARHAGNASPENAADEPSLAAPPEG